MGSTVAAAVIGEGGGSCPVAVHNLRLALPSIFYVLPYGTPTGALREKPVFNMHLKE